MPRVKLGFECKFYRSASARAGAGMISSPILVENLKDVTTTVEKEEVDTTTRANNGWETVRGALKKGPVEFKMLWKPGDDDFEAFKDAFFDDEPIALAILDGLVATTGSQGLVADFEVLKFARSEPLNGPVEVDVSLKPSDSDYAPEWVVSGGS